VTPQPVGKPIPVPAAVRQAWSSRRLAMVAVLVVAALAVGGWWLARSMTGTGGPLGTVDVPIADTAPSFDRAAPGRLALGEVVRGRLARSASNDRYHYWLIDVPAGGYKLVVDARRTDDAESNLGAQLEWVAPESTGAGSSLGTINAIASRTRAIFRFTAEQPRRAVVKYDNWYDMADYWIGLFKADDEVPAPFFTNQPAIEPLVLGRASADLLLEAKTASRRYGFAALPLSAGDYKVTVTFARPDFANSNVGGEVHVLDSEGQEIHRSLITVNKIAPSASESGKLSLAEDDTIILKRVPWFSDQRSTILIEKWEEPQ
jgi:hypothetical protein